MKLLFAAGLAAWLWGAVPAVAAPVCVDCNVILISLDTVSARHLGIYGSKAPTSPALDELARKSRVYENAFAPAPWTLPSHAAMLTGVYPWVLGTDRSFDKLPASNPTLAEGLRAQGYQAGAVTSGGYLTKAYGFGRGFESFVVTRSNSENVDKALGWIRGHRKKPFFFFLHSYRAHDPYTPSDEALEALAPGSSKGGRELGTTEKLERIATGLDTATPADLERIRLLYDGDIRDLDRELGRFFKELGALGLDRNTIFIVTADHGEELGEHGLYGLHGFTLFDEVLHVPLLVYVPGGAAARIKTPVSLVDIFPTVFNVLGLKTPEAGVNGRELPAVDAGDGASRPILAATTTVKATFFKMAAAQLTSTGKGLRPEPRPVPGKFRLVEPRGLKSVQLGAWKLIIDHSDDSLALYNLERDPLEKENVASKNAEMASELKSRWILQR